MTNAVKALLAAFAALVGVFAFFVYLGVQAHNRPAEQQPAPQVYEGGQVGRFETEEERQKHVDESTATAFGIGMLFLWACGIVVYFIPALIAMGRHHQNAAAIFVLNLFLGWTLIGWVGSLVWSATAVQQHAHRAT